MSKRQQIIRGAGGGGKGGGGGSRAPVESPDSLRSRSYARVLDLLCEGEIEGLVNGLQSVYLDDVPIQNPGGSFNFTGVALETRNGTQAQTYIPGFASVESETSVVLEVTQASPVVRSITDANVDAVRVRVSIPALYSVDSGTGDTKGTSVQYAIDLQANGGGYVEQVMGTTYTAGAVAGGQGSVPATTGIQGTAQWTRPDIEDEYASFEGVIEYQPASGGAWTTIKTISGSGRADGRTGGSGSSLLPGQQSGGFGFEVTGLSSQAYNVRARVTSGDGSVAISQVAYLTTTGTVTVTGKASSKYERSHRITLTGDAPWDIRVRRITADSGTSLLANKTFFEAYTEIIDSKLAYPNSALAGLTIDSSQFRTIPRRGYHVRLLRVQVPDNYDPVARTYTGVWDGTFTVAWTNNPAWVFYDLVTNERYGLGQFVDAAQVDKWALYTIARYCDELVPDGFGGLEPRFTCNCYLQTREEAFKVLNDLASVFRGMIYWGSGAITAVQDSPADPAMIFSAANVIDGLFTYSGSSLKSRHTVALVVWNDPADFYRQRAEYVEDPDGIALYGVVQTEVVAVGCTSRGQAHRLGRWLLYSERLESETVSFRTGLDGNICRPGQVIKIADPTRAGVRRGGRIMAGATTTSIPLDGSVTLGGGAYTLLVVEPDGTVTERAVSTGAGTHSTLTLAAALPNAPQLHAMWLLRDDTVEAQTFRVINAVENARHEIEITALAHNESKYAAIEDGVQLVVPDISDLRFQPDAPSAVAITERLYEYQAEILVQVSISWEPVERVAGYTLWWRREEGNWVVVNDLRGTEYEIEAALAGTYDVRVQAVNTLGIGSEFTEESAEVFGKILPPSDVVTFTAQQNNNVVIFKWSQIPDVDLAGYEIRYAAQSVAAWDTATPVTSVTKGTQVTTAAVPPGNWAFLIKAVDTSGVYSDAAKRADLEVISDLNVIQTDTYNPAWRGWGTAENDSMWSDDDTLLLWDQGGVMWNINPAVLMWSSVASTPMWSDVAMWTRSNIVRHWTGVLVPKSQSIAADLDFEVFDEFVPNPYDTCYYDGTEIDQDFDAQARVFATIGAALGPGETGVADPDFYIDYRTAAGTYDGMEPWTIGSVVGRYILPRIRLNTTAGIAKLIEFTVTLDAADSAQGATGVAVAPGGTAIVFNPQYHSTPRLQVSAQASGGAARFATWDDLTAAGFTAQVFDAGGNDTGGTMNWDAVGV